MEIQMDGILIVIGVVILAGVLARGDARRQQMADDLHAIREMMEGKRR